MVVPPLRCLLRDRVLADTEIRGVEEKIAKFSLSTCSKSNKVKVGLFLNKIFFKIC